MIQRSSAPGARSKGIRQGTRTSSAVDFWRQRGYQGSRSNLQSWAGINGTQGSVNFPILNTQPNTANTVYGMEKRLNISDSFIVLSIGIYIGRSATTTTANPTNAQNATTKLFTYPNPGVFTLANEATNLGIVYNGFLSIKIGNVNWFPAIAARNFYEVGQAQEVTAATNQNGVGRDEFRKQMGLMKLTPTITLNGNGNNDFTLQLPDSSLSLAAASGSFNSLVLYMDGIILPNAAGKIDLDTQNAFATQFGK